MGSTRSATVCSCCVYLLINACVSTFCPLLFRPQRRCRSGYTNGQGVALLCGVVWVCAVHHLLLLCALCSSRAGLHKADSSQCGSWWLIHQTADMCLLPLARSLPCTVGILCNCAMVQLAKPDQHYRLWRHGVPCCPPGYWPGVTAFLWKL